MNEPLRNLELLWPAEFYKNSILFLWHFSGLGQKGKGEYLIIGEHLLVPTSSTSYQRRQRRTNVVNVLPTSSTLSPPRLLLAMWRLPTSIRSTDNVKLLGCWLSGRFRRQKSEVRIQSLVVLFSIDCIKDCVEKTKIKIDREPWSIGYGRRLISWRLWVRISALYTGWTFFTYICCKNCKVCLKSWK